MGVGVETITLPVRNAEQLREIYGVQDEHLRLLERELGVSINARGNKLSIKGTHQQVEQVHNILLQVCGDIGKEVISTIRLLLRNPTTKVDDLNKTAISIPAGRKTINPRSPGQQTYIAAMRNHDMVFGVGPAGTGKTYLAMAMAIESLQKKSHERIILCRPAVEAGEKLGFLPGSMQEKINPYLRPLYDALHDMLEIEQIGNYIESGVIEVAPLAFMRGRTLANSFVILDEAQNCTPEQMKMFLTRLGMDSKAVITGDVTQIDLPGAMKSGLVEAIRILSDVPMISIHYLQETDIVRHPLVQAIVNAYANKNGTVK